MSWGCEGTSAVGAAEQTRMRGSCKAMEQYPGMKAEYPIARYLI